MTRRLLWLVCLFVASARVTAAQDSPPLATLDRDVAMRLTRIVDSAGLRGLPTEPIVAKISQGVFFHSPPDRIVVAAQSVVARLEEARIALAPKPTQSDIAAGENALGVDGATKTALQAIRSTSPNRPVAVPLGLLAQLVASKVPLPRATKIVTDLIKRGASDPQLLALGNNVSTDVVHGAQAMASLDVRLRGLTAVLAPLGSAAAAADGPQTAASGPGKKP
jgi:hypothetical protein